MTDTLSTLAPDPRVLTLLEPIPGPHPTGRPVHYDPDYSLIAAARREENAALPQGDWVRDVKRADWAAVERLCVETLTARSKDLRVACWLTEAWMQREGLSGLGGGLFLLDQFCQRFWADLHPAIESNLVARLAPLEWLNQRIPVLINLLPLVVDADQPELSFSWSNFLEAQRLEHIRLQDAGAAQRAEAKGAITLAQFTACQDRTDPAFLRGTQAAAAGAKGRLDELDATLTAACGRDAPGFGRIRTVLSEIEGFVEEVLRERAEAPPPRARQAQERAAAPPAPPQTVEQVAMSRERAYRDLARIADFLETSEPHSPVPLVLRELVAWGAMSLPEMQARLRDAGSDVSVLLQVLGVAEES